MVTKQVLPHQKSSQSVLRLQKVVVVVFLSKGSYASALILSSKAVQSLLEIMAFSVAGFPALYVLATTVLVIILVWVVARRPRNLPPGPTGLPLLGSLHVLTALPHQSLAKLAKKYGPLMSLRLGQSQCIVASSPVTALEFLKKRDANFCARPPMKSGQVLFGADIMIQNSSPMWRHMRKIFQMELTGAKRLEATRHDREEEMTYLLRTLPHNEEFEFRLHLDVFFGNIISRLVINRRLGAPVKGHVEEITEEQMLEIRSYREIMEDIPKCLTAFYPGDFIPVLKWFDFQGLDQLFKRTNKRMDAFATKIISEHQKQRQLGPVAEHEKDMVHILLDEMDDSVTDKSGPQMTMENVKGIFWDAFGGGSETSTVTCEWIMSELVSNPSAQSQAHAELDAVLSPHRRVRETDLPHLPYIQSIVKEGLRLHPPGPVLAPHQSLRPCRALGYDIPARTTLFVNVWAIARDPSVWEEPLKFKPERWLGKAEVEIGGTWLPFGAGRRICPGMALAKVALQYAVASLLQAFAWEAKGDPGMEERPGMEVSRAVPLRVVAKPRQPAEFYK